MNMKVTAKLDNLRIAPRKTKLVADLIKGLDTKVALDQLDMEVKRTSPYMKKLLLSAVANAENNFGLDKDNLYVEDVVIGAGPILKRWMPRAYGRAAQILKRTSKITIVLEERVEGKGRKTKEEMAKIMEKRLKDKKKEEKERAEVEGKEPASTRGDDHSSMRGGEKETENIKKDSGGGKSWGSKIFRRKSM
ncbi:MAG: 50S ribosomal protein L22 [Parcubacteria group bacterium]